jgi:hypothetical protein
MRDLEKALDAAQRLAATLSIAVRAEERGMGTFCDRTTAQWITLSESHMQDTVEEMGFGLAAIGRDA